MNVVRRTIPLRYRHATAIVQGCRDHGGFTFCLRNCVVPQSGFVVGVHEHSLVLSTHQKLTERRVMRFARQRRQFLLEQGNYLGCWTDEAGQIHLDVVRRVQSQVEARAIASRHRQLAVFDLAERTVDLVRSDSMA